MPARYGRPSGRVDVAPSFARSDEAEYRKELLSHADLVSDRVRSTLLAAVSVLGFGISIAGAMVAASDSALALLIAPVLSIGAVTYATQLFTDTVMLGGYQRFLEDQISGTGDPVILWETVVAPTRHGARGPFWSGLMYLMTVVLAFAIAQGRLWAEGDFVYALVQIGLFGVGLVAFYFSRRELADGWQDTYDALAAHLESEAVLGRRELLLGPPRR